MKNEQSRYTCDMNEDRQAIKDNTGYYIVAQCKPHQNMQGITKMLVMVSYMIPKCYS